MFKLGVYSIDQLTQGQDVTCLGSDKKVSVLLLNEVHALPNAQQLYDRIMFELVDDRGTYKRTSGKRFEEFDDQVLDLVKKRMKTFDAPFRFHDAAISSGQTAAEFFLKVKDLLGCVSYRASDYDPYLTVISRGPLTVVRSSSGKVIEITYPPFVFTPGRLENKLFYFGNHLLRLYLSYGPVQRLVNDYDIGLRNDITESSILLFCPLFFESAKRTQKKEYNKQKSLYFFADSKEG